MKKRPIQTLPPEMLADLPPIWLYFPSSFTADQFHSWVNERGKAFSKSGLRIFFEPSELIEWFVTEEASLSA